MKQRKPTLDAFWLSLTPAQRVVYYTVWEIAYNGPFVARSKRDVASKSILREADRVVSGDDCRRLPTEFISTLEAFLGSSPEEAEPMFFQKSILGRLLRGGRLILI